MSLREEVLEDGTGKIVKTRSCRKSLAVQWLGLHASTAGGTGSIPGQGTKIPHALQHGQIKEKKKKKED